MSSIIRFIPYSVEAAPIDVFPDESANKTALFIKGADLLFVDKHLVAIQTEVKLGIIRHERSQFNLLSNTVLNINGESPLLADPKIDTNRQPLVELGPIQDQDSQFDLVANTALHVNADSPLITDHKIDTNRQPLVELGVIEYQDAQTDVTANTALYVKGDSPVVYEVPYTNEPSPPEPPPEPEPEPPPELEYEPLLSHTVLLLNGELLEEEIE